MQNNISNINELSSVSKVKKILQGLALLDAILMPQWEDRFFSFNAHWDKSGNESMASMRDGEGNEYFIYFSDVGVVGKVLYEHEIKDPVSSLAKIPDTFENFKNEVAFNLNHTSFFFWRSIEDQKWITSENDLTCYPLVEFISNNITIYEEWAKNYYAIEIDTKVLEEVFIGLNINSKQLEVLNPELTLEDLEEDIREIFY